MCVVCMCLCWWCMEHVSVREYVICMFLCLCMCMYVDVCVVIEAYLFEEPGEGIVHCGQTAVRVICSYGHTHQRGA